MYQRGDNNFVNVCECVHLANGIEAVSVHFSGNGTISVRSRYAITANARVNPVISGA